MFDIWIDRCTKYKNNTVEKQKPKSWKQE
uniref:Uncharacterized protein n=1 Tax=Arundo donax TaxID=35708 RepID=A0A0A9FRY6_ARUDO